jgi:sporulation protein YlmC with PRC-barrel domain
MSAKSVATILVATALLGNVAFAQTANQTQIDRTETAMIKDGAWRASKLPGVNVYNEANEKIGDINEIILDRSGKVSSVILGVGGFLGMGEHYVAVAYDKFQWVNQPVRSNTVSSTDGTTRPASNVDGTTRPAVDGTPRTTTGTAMTRTGSENWYPDHAVLNATKDQLKAMPEFKY